MGQGAGLTSHPRLTYMQPRERGWALKSSSLLPGPKNNFIYFFYFSFYKEPLLQHRDRHRSSLHILCEHELEIRPKGNGEIS